MVQYNSLHEDYMPVTLFDNPALFTPLRINRKTVPEGMFAYDIRHSDDDCGLAATVEPRVAVNHMGTIIVSEPLDFGEDDFLVLDYERCDLNFEADFDASTIIEYAQYISEQQRGQELGHEPTMEM